MIVGVIGEHRVGDHFALLLHGLDYLRRELLAGKSVRPHSVDLV